MQQTDCKDVGQMASRRLKKRACLLQWNVWSWPCQHPLPSSGSKALAAEWSRALLPPPPTPHHHPTPAQGGWCHLCNQSVSSPGHCVWLKMGPLSYSLHQWWLQHCSWSWRTWGPPFKLWVEEDRVLGGEAASCCATALHRWPARDADDKTM